MEITTAGTAGGMGTADPSSATAALPNDEPTPRYYLMSARHNNKMNCKENGDGGRRDRNDIGSVCEYSGNGVAVLRGGTDGAGGAPDDLRPPQAKHNII